MINTPVLLDTTHDLQSFTCGNASLDQWLKNRAHANQSSGASRCYVLTNDQNVIGFYALSSGGVAAAEAPGRIKRNMPDPVPVMILARFAIDVSWQGKGFGRDLLRDAILRTLRAAEIGGIRALLTHAKDENAAAFYESNGFLPSPIRPLTLFLPLR